MYHFIPTITTIKEVLTSPNIALKLLDLVGFYGPFVIAMSTISGLWYQTIYLRGYLVLFVLNSIVNKVLKQLTRDPRPPGGKSIVDEQYDGADKYGMPSGHAQSVWMSSVFLYLVNGSFGTALFHFFLIILTLYQRWKYKRHTTEQLLVGSFVGGVLAVLCYHILTKFITGTIDNGTYDTEIRNIMSL